MTLTHLSKQLIANQDVDCTLLEMSPDYIFFNKGSGVHSVAQDFCETATAANWLLTLDDELRSVSKPLESGLLHRLDFETSGVMVAARHVSAFERLKKLIKEEAVTKEYVCLISREGLKPGKYEAYAYGRSKSSKKVTVVLKKPQAYDAKKIVTIVKHSERRSDGMILVTLNIITGFRHQIRAHLAALGFSLVGDKLYGGADAKRLMLHAQRFAFTVDDKNISVVCSAPF